MSSNFIVGGIIFTPVVPQVVIAMLLTILVSFIFTRIGLFRFVWHRPLVEVCLFCLILGVLVILSPDGTTWSFSAQPEQAL